MLACRRCLLARIASACGRHHPIEGDLFLASDGIVETAEVPQRLSGQTQRSGPDEEFGCRSALDKRKTAMAGFCCRTSRRFKARLGPEKKHQTGFDISC